MKKRIYELDWLRAFAALSVIAIHITSTYVTKNEVAYVWNQAMRYAVPLFIILSGFLLFYSDRNRSSISYAAFYKKRFSKIAVPYLVWTIFYALYKHRHELVSGEYSVFIVGLVKYILFGTGFVHLYFLIIMVQLYLIYPLLYLWLKKHAKSFLTVTFLLTLASELVLYMHALGVYKLPRLQVPYVIMLPLWIFYFAAGMYAAKHKEDWEPYMRGKQLTLGVLYVLSFALLLYDSKQTGTFDSSMKPTVLLYCFISCFYFYSLAVKAKEIRGRIGKFVDWFSAQSFLIFLLHPFVLTLLMHKRIGLATFWGVNIGLVLLFITVTAITICCTYLLSFLPFVAYIGGVRRDLKISHHSEKTRVSSRLPG
jgi:peptidoglycan/LPS O-acetylase OafA/YrhL